MANFTFILSLSTAGSIKCPFPPLSCDVGEQLILFLSDPAKTADGTGLIVADILQVTYIWQTGKYDYLLSFNEDLLTPGLSGISQCDLLEWCCYTCQSKYTDTKSGAATCSEVLACIDVLNGLNLNSNEVKLGGDLVEDTAVSQENFDMLFDLTGSGNFAVQNDGDPGLFVENATGYVGVNTETPSTPLHVVKTSNVSGSDLADVATLELVSTNPPVGLGIVKSLRTNYYLTNSAGNQYLAAIHGIAGITHTPGAEVVEQTWQLASGSGAPEYSMTLFRLGAATGLTVGEVSASEGNLILVEVGGNSVTLGPSTSSAAAYNFRFPPDGGTNTYLLQTDGSGNTSWTPQPSSYSNWKFISGPDPGDGQQTVNDGDQVLFTAGVGIDTFSWNTNELEIAIRLDNLPANNIATFGSNGGLYVPDATFISNAGCGTAGVGSGKMVTAATALNNAITLTCAAEHSTSSNVTTQTDTSLAIDIDTADPTALTAADTGVITYNNISACRSSELKYLAWYSVEVDVSTLGQWKFSGRLNVNGGGMGNVVNNTYGAYPNNNARTWTQSFIGGVLTIAPAGSVTLRGLCAILIEVTSSGTSVWDAASTRIMAWQNTI